VARVDGGSVAPEDVTLFGPFSTVCSPRFSVSFGLGRSRMSLTEKEEVLGILIERSF